MNSEARQRPFLQIFKSWRLAVTFLLGFVSGLPLALSFATLQAWLKDEKVDLTTIGLFSLVGLPYTIKFLWSPLMDRFVPPFLGRRRGWLVITLASMILSIIGMSMTHPGSHPALMAGLALLLAFSSASFDIANDAYRIELLEKHEYGIGTSLYVSAYRLAMIVSGGGALVLSDHLPWRGVYLVMGAMLAIGFLVIYLAPEPKLAASAPRSIREAVIEPLQEFLFNRRGGLETLIFLVIYKLDTNLTVAMTTPFMMDLQFSKTEIGAIVKAGGLAGTIVGSLIGGLVMTRISVKRALWLFGITQAVAGLTYYSLAVAGHNYPLMVAAITVENVFSGMGITAMNALMMMMCDLRFTATQFALITSFMGLSRYVAGAPSGWLAEHAGWPTYFIICTLSGIPALLLLLRYDRWALPNAEAARKSG